MADTKVTPPSERIKTPLSERIRPNCEAAPWVIEEIKKLEAALDLIAWSTGVRIANLEEETGGRVMGVVIDSTEKLVRELRLVSSSAELIPARHLCQLAADRIAELEAERDDARRVMKEACEANRVYVRQLEAIRKLPEKWRQLIGIRVASKEADKACDTVFRDLADELQALLDRE